MIKVKAEFVCDKCESNSFDGDLYLNITNKTCSSMTCYYDSSYPDLPDGWNFVGKPAGAIFNILDDYVIKECHTGGCLMYCPVCSEGLRKGW